MILPSDPKEKPGVLASRFPGIKGYATPMSRHIRVFMAQGTYEIYRLPARRA